MDHILFKVILVCKPSIKPRPHCKRLRRLIEFNPTTWKFFISFCSRFIHSKQSIISVSVINLFWSFIGFGKLWKMCDWCFGVFFKCAAAALRGRLGEKMLFSLPHSPRDLSRVTGSEALALFIYTPLRSFFLKNGCAHLEAISLPGYQHSETEPWATFHGRTLTQHGQITSQHTRTIMLI